LIRKLDDSVEEDDEELEEIADMEDIDARSDRIRELLARALRQSLD